MLEFIRILLFGSSVLLTPDPIEIVNEPFELQFEEPISAVTAGAAFYIDVTAMVPYEVQNIFQARAWAEKAFGKESISIVLINDATERELTLLYKGGFGWSETTADLTIGAEGGFPKTVEYDRLVLTSDTDLYGVRIVWKNYRY
ncbi:hypothetical protein [Marinimicrobium sp. ARAG 43.8]|uniref:hypothetical protein n=1 Tax=Marinimicrobium sp. ARAG 43.8 TaxID=3418719 RepID=UPI003CE8BEE1